MSCCDNRYAPLRASGELTDAHLDALRQYAQDTRNGSKPVYRANCPPGYTHCTRAFPTDKPGTVANNKLWFIDGHGHLCMPKCGWGAQPELRLKDQAAQMVRSGEMDPTKVTPEKIQAAAARMQCDPCGKGKKNVSRVANMLSCTLRDLDRVDKEIDAKVAEGKKALEGGMYGGGGMGGCWSRSSMSGGMHGMHTPPTPPSPASLAGGATSTAAKCELQAMVGGLDAEKISKLTTLASTALASVTDKKREHHKNKLLCKLLALHEQSPLLKLRAYDDGTRDYVLQTEEDLKALAVQSVAQAVYCASTAPWVDPADAKAKGCVPSSCYSKSFKIDDTDLNKSIKTFKLEKHLFDTLIHLFVEYKKVLKLCEPEKAEAERVWECKVTQAFTKLQNDAQKCGVPVPPIFRQRTRVTSQMKTVAALKCDEPNNADKCKAAGGKQVCSGTTMVCIPATLADLKERMKRDKNEIKLNSMIQEYQKVIIADVRRTLNA